MHISYPQALALLRAVIQLAIDLQLGALVSRSTYATATQAREAAIAAMREATDLIIASNGLPSPDTRRTISRLVEAAERASRAAERLGARRPPELSAAQEEALEEPLALEDGQPGS